VLSESDEILKAIMALVDTNVLQYNTRDSRLQCHGRLQKLEFENYRVGK